MIHPRPSSFPAQAHQPAAEDAIPTCVETFLNTQLKTYFAAHSGSLPAPGLYDRLLAKVEKPLIQQTLEATGGNQIKAAHILGLNRNTLRKKMRALGLDARAWSKELTR